MIDVHFTVQEFVEILAASVLAGLLVGSLLIYLYLLCRNRRSIRRHYFKDGTKRRHSSHHNGDDQNSVIDIHPVNGRRQTPTLPIQLPPVEDPSFSDDVLQDLPASLWAEAGSSHVGRPISDSLHEFQTPKSQLASFPSVATISSTDNQTNYLSPRAFSTGNSRHSRHSHFAAGKNNSYGEKDASASDPGSPVHSTADVSLSRTTTNVSTLPPYDGLSSGPPRYPSSLRTSNSASLAPDQASPGLVPPLPDRPDPWRTKQDGSGRF